MSPPTNRREFLALAAGTVIGTGWQNRTPVRVSGPRVVSQLEGLARIGRTPEGGSARVAFSEADRAAREYVAGLMRQAQLEVETDAAANLIGRRAGRRDLPPLMFGSHIDSVPNGGHYDGPVGSIGAIEVARTLAEAGVPNRHPLEVIVFANEEGGKTGSRALSGEVEPSELELPTASGRTIGQGLAFAGGDPDRLDEVKRSPAEIAVYLELHIEQGAVLESRGADIGVVEGIVGIRRWNVTVSGSANHAGTTPMDQRRDALVAAAEFVTRVNHTAREMTGGQVATVGRIEAEPGAPNVIPGRVTLSLEIRDLAMEKIDAVFERLREEAGRIGAETATDFDFAPFYLSRAAPTDPRLRDLVEQSARVLGLSSLRLPSGAGHDAQSIALLAPVGMIFVPSAGGISHSPREFTDPAQIVHGVDVLLATLLAADQQDW